MPSHPRPPATDELPSIDFRTWLKDRIAATGHSLNRVERDAGIRGNALGKFLRGERGSRHGLTPRHIRRLAPALAISEAEMLAHAGHLSSVPQRISVEEAIRADRLLRMADKQLLIGVYRRLIHDAAQPPSEASEQASA